MPFKEKHTTLIKLVLLFVLLMVLMPVSYHSWDMACWRDWTLHIFKNGLGEAYNGNINYPPVMLYILYLFGHLLGSEARITEHIDTIRIFTLLFDFAPALFILYGQRFLPDRKSKVWLLLLNVAYFYNSLIWGQVDGISSNLILFSIALAFEFPVWSALCFILALNTKLQAIIFLPILFLILMPRLRDSRAILKIILPAMALQVILLIPFIISGNIKGLWDVITSAVDYYPYVSMNAFNFWHLVTSEDPAQINDATTWLIISYKQAGLMLFFLFSTVILMPLLIHVIRQFRFPKRVFQKETVFLVAGLLAVAFFYLNTQMHERYAQPSIILFFFYGLYSHNYFFYGMASVACFLNLEKILSFLPVAHHTAIFHPVFVSLLFLIILMTGIFVLYRDLTRDSNAQLST